MTGFMIGPKSLGLWKPMPTYLQSRSH